VIFDLFPWPTGRGHIFKITEGPVLKPCSYTKDFGTFSQNVITVSRPEHLVDIARSAHMAKTLWTYTYLLLISS